MEKKRDDLREAFRVIGRYGKSEISIDAFLSRIATGFSEDRSGHLMVVAEIMAKLAPDEQKDAWYVTGLLHEILISDLSEDTTPRDMLKLMKDSGISPETISCLTNYGRIQNPRKWGSRMSALYFADIHTDGLGNIMTTSDCCSRNKGGPLCSDCSYVSFVLNEMGLRNRAEFLLSELAGKMDIQAEKMRSDARRESLYGIPEKRGMEEGDT